MFVFCVLVKELFIQTNYREIPFNKIAKKKIL